MITPSAIAERLASVGYVARRRETLAVAALLSHRGGGAPALLLEGPPGAGKTALGEAVARAWDWPCVYCLLHAWTDADELHVGVDVAAAVGGDAERVRQPGVLARAAALTYEHERVVLVLDEIDKSSERCEALLLDFLQSGRVPTRPGEHVQADLSRLLVLITSNGQRELSDALLRRVRRVAVEPLPVEQLDALAVERSGAPTGVVRLVSRACRELAAADDAVVSLQEIAHASREIWEIAESHDDVREILAAWGARGEAGRSAADRCRLVSAIWAEVVAARRRAV